jgi:hypothetical protein
MEAARPVEPQVEFAVGWFIQLLRLAKGGSTAKLATRSVCMYKQPAHNCSQHNTAPHNWTAIADNVAQ